MTVSCTHAVAAGLNPSCAGTGLVSGVSDFVPLLRTVSRGLYRKDSFCQAVVQAQKRCSVNNARKQLVAVFDLA